MDERERALGGEGRGRTCALGDGRERADESRLAGEVASRPRRKEPKQRTAGTGRRVHDGRAMCQSDAKDEGLGCRTLERRFNMTRRGSHEYGMGNRMAAMKCGVGETGGA